MSEDNNLAITEEELDQARAEREGTETLLEGFEAGVETAQPGGAASATAISKKAFDLIVEFEVSSEQVYSRKYRSTIWPGGASGVTIGIGYDLGFATKTQLEADFGGVISPETIRVLHPALGLTGAAAQQAARDLSGAVDVPWTAAITVHCGKVIPRWVGLVERSLKNTHAIGPDRLGVLVSLTYNRGASFSRQGDRFTEMRAVKSHMASGKFGSIPNELRSMKRLWPTVPGLQKRREREAVLFESALN
ncbi:hypothetical protein LPLAFNJD_LOCUS2351 [Methylorubrum aminovorans]